MTMNPNPYLSVLQQKKLIKLVKETPILYRSDDTQNVLNSEEAWKEIGKKMKYPTDKCKKVWEDLKNCFLKSMDGESSSDKFMKVFGGSLNFLHGKKANRRTKLKSTSAPNVSKSQSMSQPTSEPVVQCTGLTIDSLDFILRVRKDTPDIDVLVLEDFFKQVTQRVDEVLDEHIIKETSLPNTSFEQVHLPKIMDDESLVEKSDPLIDVEDKTELVCESPSCETMDVKTEMELDAPEVEQPITDQTQMCTLIDEIDHDSILSKNTPPPQSSSPEESEIPDDNDILCTSNYGDTTTIFDLYKRHEQSNVLFFKQAAEYISDRFMPSVQRQLRLKFCAMVIEAEIKDINKKK